MSSPVLDHEVAESGHERRSRGMPTSIASWLVARGVTPIVVFSAVYLVATSVIATRRPPWNDEVYTFYFARIHGIADLWRALETGADQAPPLSYLLARGSLDAFGSGPLSLRLPEIVAFLVFSISMYTFVARRTNWLYGLMAMVVPTLTAAYYYASEARGYALVLAFGAVALVCWQAATDGTHRRLALVGLAVALALATSSHYYAILLLVPLALGELVRSVAGRRMDIWVWLALGGGLVPLAAFVQLVRASKGYSADFWGRPSWSDAPKFFSFLFDTRPTAGGVELGQIGRPTTWWLVLLAIGVLTLALVVVSPLAQWLRSTRRGRAALLATAVGLSLAAVIAAASISSIPVSVVSVAAVGLAGCVLTAYVVTRTAGAVAPLAGPPLHEVVAAAGFLVLPFAAVVLAKTVTNAYTDRYSLPAVIGLVVLPLALYRLEGRRPLVGASVVAALAGAFVVAASVQAQHASDLAAQQDRTVRFLEQHAGAGLPILVENPHVYLELTRASPPALAERLLYVADPAWDSTQRGLIAVGRIASLHVYDRKDAATLPNPLLGLSLRPEADWSDARSWSDLRLLREEGRIISEKARDGKRILYTIGESR